MLVGPVWTPTRPPEAATRRAKVRKAGGYGSQAGFHPRGRGGLRGGHDGFAGPFAGRYPGRSPFVRGGVDTGSAVGPPSTSPTPTSVGQPAQTAIERPGHRRRPEPGLARRTRLPPKPLQLTGPRSREPPRAHRSRTALTGPAGHRVRRRPSGPAGRARHACPPLTALPAARAGPSNGAATRRTHAQPPPATTLRAPRARSAAGVLDRGIHLFGAREIPPHRNSKAALNPF